MIKQAWITKFNKHLVTLSIEGRYTEPKHMRIQCREMDSPAVPTKEHPLRHTIEISLLDQDSINILAQCLDKHRTDTSNALICNNCSKRWSADCPRRDNERKGINPTLWNESCEECETK